MSNNGFESPVTLTSGYTRMARRRAKREENFSSAGGPPLEDKKRVKFSTPPKSRFNIALGKSLIVRSTFLKRRLTRTEFKQLVRAVRKQISPVLSRNENILASFEKRIHALERSVPGDALNLQDSISSFAAQVSVLREQCVQLIIERDEIGETCGHYRHRRNVYPKNVPFLEYKIPGLGLVVPSVKEVETLACATCTIKREEQLFYWTGCSFASFVDSLADESDRKTYEKCVIRSVSPLSIQSVWSAVLNLKYNRVHTTWSGKSS